MKGVSLRQARRRAKLTQAALAEAAHVPQSVISRLESGRASDPNFRTVVALARVLDLAPEQLRFGVQERVAS